MARSPQIRILVNELPQTVPEGTTTGRLCDRFKPGADVIVLNGFPEGPGTAVKPGDRVVLIQRGEVPVREELEALMAARHTPGVHERMRCSRVGVAGLGGLGSAVALALARMGVGELVLADFDVVEPSNLNRQHYTVEDIGHAKTDAMSRRLARVNPAVRVVAHRAVLDESNIPALFHDVDVLVECLDRAEAKALLIRTAAGSLPGAYVVGASGVAGYGEGNRIGVVRLGARVFMVGDLLTAAEPGRGLMAPRVGIAAHHQANLVVSLLMEGEDAVL